MEEKKKKSDEHFGNYIITFYLILVCNFSVKTLKIPMNLPMLFLLLGSIYFISAYKYFIAIVIKKRLIHLVVAEIIFGTILILSAIWNSFPVPFFINRIVWSSISISIFLAIYLMEDKHIVYEKMRKYSYLISGMLIFSYILTKENTSYNMSLGYYLLPTSLMHINEWIEGKNRILNSLFCIVEIYIICVFGSRGVMLCLLSYIGIRIFMKLKTVQAKIVFSSLTVILLGIVFLGFQMLDTSNEIVDNSYILSSLKNGTFFKSARSTIYKDSLEMILEKPILGWGIAGEFFILGTYPHNLFLELMIDFGVLLGGTFSIYFIFKIIMAFKANTNIKELLLIFLCAGFFPTMLSGSWLLDWKLFLFSGMIFSIVSKKNKKRAEIN